MHSISNPIVHQITDSVSQLRENWLFSIVLGQIETRSNFVPVNGGHVMNDNRIGLLLENESGGFYFEPYVIGQESKFFLENTQYWTERLKEKNDDFWDKTDDFSNEYYPLYPHFFFGHQKELKQDLKQLTNAKIGGRFKYPFIHLLMPFSENGPSYETNTSLNFTFAMITDKKYSTAKRYEVNVIPTLNPILFQFLESLEKEGVKIDDLNKTKIDQVFWGREEAEQVLCDPIDAVSLQIDCIFNQTKC